MINIINIGKVIFYEYFYFCFILNLRDFGDLCMFVLVLFLMCFIFLIFEWILLYLLILLYFD